MENVACRWETSPVDDKRLPHSLALSPLLAIQLPKQQPASLPKHLYTTPQDPTAALAAYAAARAAAPTDGRLLYEQDQLRKRLGHAAEDRLAALQAHPDLVAARDALAVEVAALLNQTGRAAAALELLKGRRFQPWEGGEGEALGQWVRTHCTLGRAALEVRSTVNVINGQRSTLYCMFCV